MNDMNTTTVRNTNGVATAALIFAIVAAAFSALTYLTLPAMVQRGVENVESMKVGGHEKYEQLKKIYMDNASVFGEQVDQIQSQIETYKQMQAQGGMMGGNMEDETMTPSTSADTDTEEAMPTDETMTGANQ